MKKLLILLALAFTMLVACSEASDSSSGPSNLKVGDKGTVSATKLENGDYQFDFTLLGVSDSQAMAVVSKYLVGDVEVATVNKFPKYDETGKPLNDYLWDISWAPDGEHTWEVPDGANGLEPLIPVSTGFVFADNEKTTVKIIVDIDGKQNEIIYEGTIPNGNGEVVIKAIEPVL